MRSRPGYVVEVFYGVANELDGLKPAGCFTIFALSEEHAIREGHATTLGQGAAYFKVRRRCKKADEVIFDSRKGDLHWDSEETDPKS